MEMVLLWLQTICLEISLHKFKPLFKIYISYKMPLQLFTANGVQFRGIKDAERAAKFTPESQNAL
jgi:hypothetical protein